MVAEAVEDMTVEVISVEAVVEGEGEGCATRFKMEIARKDLRADLVMIKEMEVGEIGPVATEEEEEGEVARGTATIVTVAGEEEVEEAFAMLIRRGTAREEVPVDLVMRNAAIDAPLRCHSELVLTQPRCRGLGRNLSSEK